MMRFILTLTAVLSICAPACAATVGSDIQERFLHFNVSILVDGVREDLDTGWANRDLVHYSADIDGGTVQSLELIPTGGVEFVGAAFELVDGHEFRFNGNVIPGDPLRFRVSTSYDRGDYEIGFVPVETIDQPITWGELTSHGDGMYTLADVDGPWYLPGTTVFSMTEGGTDYEVVLDRVGWFLKDEITLDAAVPEPSTWGLALVAAGALIGARRRLRCSVG